jgi:hypothetical protein
VKTAGQQNLYAAGQQARTELQPRLGAHGWAGVIDELRDELRRHRVDGVVKFPVTPGSSPRSIPAELGPGQPAPTVSVLVGIIADNTTGAA